jgi:hypothetical protein
MKGVKYNLLMKLPNDSSYTNSSLKMDELCKEISEKIKDNYFIDCFNISNQVIYNLIKRPNNVNKFLREKVKVMKC